MEAMKAIGNAGEGILISHMPTVDGSGRDGIVPGILKKEWFEELKERLPAANSAVW